MYVHIGCMAPITAEATTTLGTFSDCGYIHAHVHVVSGEGQ